MFQIQFQFLKQSKNETKFPTLFSSSKSELKHSKNEEKTWTLIVSQLVCIIEQNNYLQMKWNFIIANESPNKNREKTLTKN